MSNQHSTQPLLPIPEPPADGRTFINPSLWFVDEDVYRVIYCRYQPLYRVALGDEVHLRQVAVALRQSSRMARPVFPLVCCKATYSPKKVRDYTKVDYSPQRTQGIPAV